MSSTIFGIIIVLIVLFIMSFYLMRTIKIFNDDETHNIVKSNTSPQTAMEIVFDRNGVVDCNSTRLPCVSDRQCIDNCLVQTAVGALVCDNGFCSNRDSSIGGGRPDDFECDSALGLIKAFIASEFVVDQLCISTYRDIVDDLGEPRPYLCTNGTLDIDLVNRQFSASDCTCSWGYTKMLFNQTALARSIPVCVPNRSRTLFGKIYDAL